MSFTIISYIPITQDTDRQTHTRDTLISTLTSTHIISCINISSSIQKLSHSFHMSICRGPNQSSPSILSPHPTITGINTIPMVALRKVHIIIDNNCIHTNNEKHIQTDRLTDRQTDKRYTDINILMSLHSHYPLH